MAYISRNVQYQNLIQDIDPKINRNNYEQIFSTMSQYQLQDKLNTLIRNPLDRATINPLQLSNDYSPIQKVALMVGYYNRLAHYCEDILCKKNGFNDYYKAKIDSFELLLNLILEKDKSALNFITIKDDSDKKENSKVVQINIMGITPVSIHADPSNLNWVLGNVNISSKQRAQLEAKKIDDIAQSSSVFWFQRQKLDKDRAREYENDLINCKFLNPDVQIFDIIKSKLDGNEYQSGISSECFYNCSISEESHSAFFNWINCPEKIRKDRAKVISYYNKYKKELEKALNEYVGANKIVDKLKKKKILDKFNTLRDCFNITSNFCGGNKGIFDFFDKDGFKSCLNKFDNFENELDTNINEELEFSDQIGGAVFIEDFLTDKNKKEMILYKLRFLKETNPEKYKKICENYEIADKFKNEVESEKFINIVKTCEYDEEIYKYLFKDYYTNCKGTLISCNLFNETKYKFKREGKKNILIHLMPDTDKLSNYDLEDQEMLAQKYDIEKLKQITIMNEAIDNCSCNDNEKIYMKDLLKEVSMQKYNISESDFLNLKFRFKLQKQIYDELKEDLEDFAKDSKDDIPEVRERIEALQEELSKKNGENEEELF